MIAQIRAKTPGLRTQLLIGASIGAMLLTGVAEAQSGRGRGGAANPAEAAVRAAQAQANQAAQTSSASQRAVAAFRRAAEGRNAMQAAQAAARAAAQAAQSNVPNGLGQGGLQVADGVALDPSLWIGAKGPTQTTSADGRTAVSVDQTSQQAILTWDSFNVGRDTDLTFNQQGADWVALNRVTDASADPTRILGSIKAAGSVYILNRNGVIFGGASQVNVRNLVASSAGVTDDQFLKRGLYSALANGEYLPSFTDAGGAISVEAGARITTNTPTSVTAGGGFVLLMGTEVTNQGSITTPRGQTLLAAGDDFLVRRGFGTEENPYSTTRGNEVRGLIDAGSTSGAVTNAGQIEAAQGDITLAGRTIRQDGVMVATTSVNQRGTIHLLNSASDAEGSVTLGEDSLTLILPELDSTDTALNGQRDALITASDKANLNRFTTVTGGFDDRSLQADRQDQGRVEIVTGGNVVFEGGSQTMANGGQVAVQANAGRITVKDGASINVSGTMGVALDMASNSIQVNVQGNELRDSPDNRDSDALKNQNVWIDVRDLVLLPSGTGGYDGDRWYTPGGLFEVGGYLANTAHGVGEWTAVGGTITLAAREVLAEQGAVFDISGGSLDYAAGYVRSSLMLGVDGRMYDVRNAPAGMTFVGVGNAFMRKHDRWGSQYDEVYNNRLFSRGTTMRWEEGYTVGRDAGRLILSTPTAIMEADILAGVINGERQIQTRADGVTDGYQLGQHTVAMAGTLAIGNYVAVGRETPFNTDVRIDDVAAVTGDAIPEDRTNTVWLDATHLNAQGLGGLAITTGASVTFDKALTLATGGVLDVTAPIVNLNAGVTARSGSILVGNVFTPAGVDRNPLVLTQSGAALVTVGEGAVLDMRGLWINDTSGHALGLGHLDGGTVSLSSTGSVVMSAGSAIDVSSGGAVVAQGAFKGGRGGDVTLSAGYEGGRAGAPARLLLDGDIRGYGVSGGGALTLQAENIQIGGSASDDDTLVLAQDFFDKGFSAYEAFGNSGLVVADGAAVNVVMPVLRLTDAGLALETGSDPAGGLELWTPPLYQEDAANGVLGQRAGASLTLKAGGVVDTLADTALIALTIGRGAVVSVDPGQSIALLSGGQTTINGRLNAWGGAIEVGATEVAARSYSDPIYNALPDTAIWIGEDAVLDVAARAATAVDVRGNRYGIVADGGRITLGDPIDEATGKLSLGAFVVVREGALLDASGAQATLDLLGRPATLVASDGGVISLATSGGLYLHGDFKASAGGAGAAGGTLELSMESSLVAVANPIDRLSQARELVITQGRSDLDVFGSDTAESGTARFDYGHGAISVDQITEGGFGDLILGVKGQISFVGDLDLNLSQSVRLYAASLALGDDAASDADISITAPYIRLAGARPQVTQQPGVTEAVVFGVSSRESEARLALNADLLDVRDLIGFGAGGTLPHTGGAVPYDRRGFADVALNSSGDLRFLQQTGDNGTRLTTADRLTLTAAQIYPATHAVATVVADRIDIGRSTTATPALPYSAFGQLSLLGKVVNQGGVVRAPLGIVTLGQANGFEGAQGSTEVNLLAGSVTSVSGAGLVMPYGGTVDGIVYTYDGVKLSDSLLGVQPVKAAVKIEGQSIEVAQGAVIDVSGGGDLTGAGFVSGRGGSVDVLNTALANTNPGYVFSNGASSVYAIVPGHVGYAPVSPEAGAGDPMIGQQITLEAGAGGLPAGVYTLMPSTYALLPGAFRVEVAAGTDPRGAGVSAAVGNGSYVVAGRLGVANTGILESLTRQVVVTPGDVVRRYSLYNETGFSDFVASDAARLGVPRIRLPGDAQGLTLNFATNRTDRSAFSFLGEFRNAPVKDGWGGEVVLTTASRGSIEIVDAGAGATADFVGVSVNDADINRLNAGRLLIGGATQTLYGQAGNYVNFASNVGNVIVRSGANLSASEIFLVSGVGVDDFGITVEQGAVLNTLGKGVVGQDSRDGFIYVPLNHSVFAVSNSYITMLAPRPNDNAGFGPGRIDIGGCQGVCSGVTQLYSEGTIVAATDKAFTLDNAVRFGTRSLTLAVGGINIGTEASLAQATADGILPAGLELNQSVLERLLRGDTSTGAPALETLVLTARDSVNLFGTVTLDTLDPVTGKSLLSNLVLTSGGIYGHGTASDVATIRTANFIWNGTVDAAPAVMAGGAGTGAGALNIEAQRIEFGFGQDAVAAGRTYDRLALGFAAVNLTASDRVTANHAGSLKIYQTQSAYTPGVGYAYSGGALNITAPLITGEAGSVNAVTVGGAVSLAGAGSAAAISDLGGTLSIRGASLNVNTAITLPSGKLTLVSDGDVVLGDAARIDMSGRELTFFDVKKYSWGGDVTLESRTGNILQSAGSSINLSAENNYAGALRAVALDADAGRVDLLGGITATTSGLYDAGGTIVPYRAGSVELRGTSLGDFAALNSRLNTGGVFGGRYFQITQGDLTIGNEVRASDVGVSLDNGQLTVNGTIDASGAQVGRIRLFASDGLTLTGTAVLDAHGELLRVDSYGKIIDSPNRAIVELGSGAGTLTLASGSRIDLRHGVKSLQNDGVARGTLELNAPRLGADDIAIDAGGALTIQGARSIAINAMRTYSGGEIPFGTDATATGRPYQVIDQAWLNDRHGESESFINAALGNGSLMQGRLAGLNNATYRDVLHVRPGVEIATEGDLVVSGDLDLSGHRYAGINPNFQQTAVYGSGEVGRLTLRAGGDLSVYGSITDGFTPPPEAMPEEDGWVLLPGEQMFNADVIVPRAGIELQPGTTYPVGQALNYDLPMAGKLIALGTRLPVATTLTADVNLPADIILSAAIRNPDGSVAYAAGTRMPAGVTLTSGMTLDAGTLLPVAIEIGAVIWPKGVPLPSRPADTVTGDLVDFVALDTAIVLPMGGLIPAGSKVELGAGVDSINLRGGDGKGRSWALAQMLPEGSQSWSLRLVAGADLGAADERLTVPNVEHGRLMLADLHYGMTGRGVIAGVRIQLTTAGSIDLLGTDAYGGLTEDELNERFLADFGLTFAELFGTTFEDACTWGASYCETVGGGALGLTETGSIDLLGNSSYAGLTLAQLDERLLAEIGLDFATLMGTTLEDACAWSGDYCQMVGSGPVTYEYTPATTALSVVRTGTGDLDLVSGGDLSVQSLYGVYTAGVSSLSLADSLAGGFNTPRPTSIGDKILKGAGHEQYVDGGEQSLYRAWYPDLGGNLSVAVGGNLTGDLVGTKRDSFGVGVPQFASSDVSNWLWRQSSTQDVGGATAWWINFGTYATAGELTGTVGFTGFGTLGGGDLDVRVAGDAGTLSRRGSDSSTRATRSQGLVLAVGSTGRMVDGQLVQTGGGDMDVRIGGGLNPELDARAYYDGGTRRLLSNRQDLAGAFVNLRGTMQVDAGAIGGIETVTGDNALYQDAKETRAYDPFSPTMASATGGILIAPGDATVRLNTRGDLVLASAVDAGRVNQRNPGAYSIETLNGLETGTGGAAAWFTLWTDRTAIDLFSAGGNMTPITALAEMNITGNTPTPYANEGAPSDGRFVYPSILRATAAGGSIFYGASGVYDAQSGNTANPRYSLVLAPGGNGQLEFLAADSLYSGGYVVSPSGADATTVATPFNPAVGVYGRYNFEYKYAGPGLNYTVFGAGGMMPLFAFGPNTATGSNAGAPAPARFYARDGDLVGVRSGAVLTLGLSGTTLYEGARPVWMQAGRDIVNSGTPVGVVDELSPGFNIIQDNGRSNLFVHTKDSDVSVVSAGRDILFSSFNVAGPGTLEVSAGRNIQMEDRASLTSLGPIALGDTRPGASIVMAAAMTGMDFAAIRDRYLDPANLADADFPLVHPNNEGKVAQVYDKELIDWLGDLYGFDGTVAEALTYFDALAPEQQRVFLRQVYFAETREGGREYNDADGPRFASYLRGRQMIATLFPDKDKDGKDIARAGDIIMFGGSGVRTNFGGDIQMLVPGGQIVAGVQGQVPPATSGIVTQGAGDINLFSEGSLLLGLSRVMTTFGGDIFAWSEEGDINAGRGSKTTVVYTPPKRTYDDYGNVALAPQVPSSGAGIATLNPIPEVPPGDVDLIAPLGTIDAGEAGIRVSGNVNLAALQVLNAANIQVDGDAKGIPLPPVVNTGALTAASSATNAVVAEATRLAEQTRPIRSDLPAIITSRFLGFGED